MGKCGLIFFLNRKDRGRKQDSLILYTFSGESAQVFSLFKNQLIFIILIKVYKVRFIINIMMFNAQFLEF